MQKTDFVTAIVLANGKGYRFSADVNKVCQSFNGLRIFEYSLETFQNLDPIDEIILVGPEDLDKKALHLSYPKLTHIVSGGMLDKRVFSMVY